MTIYLDELLDVDRLGQMLDQGYVQVRHHPKYPYAIYCYTKQAMFDREWNDVTKICRGLIVNEDSAEILARPFKKFFNYGEPDAPVLRPDEFVQVYDKVDGSLGIVYPTPDGPQIATKGSFSSDQALHASNLLQSVYVDYRAIEGVTDLFEIVYPENRIVLDYGDADKLVYLGSVGIGSGDSYYRDLDGMGFDHAERRSFGEFSKVLPLYLDMKRPNAEGVVIHAEARDIRLKVKQEDYIELHKVMTGLNERQLWEWLSQGRYGTDILADLPEEMHSWAWPIITNFCDLEGNKRMDLKFAWSESRYMDRKDFALFNANKEPWLKGALFARYDGNEDRVTEIIWKAVRP